MSRILRKFVALGLGPALLIGLNASTTAAGAAVDRAATASAATTQTAPLASNPRCISKREWNSLKMTADPFTSGTTLRQARKIIGSLGTTMVSPNHDFDNYLDGFLGGYLYQTAVFAFGVLPEYDYGYAPNTRTCKPWKAHSYVALIFRRYLSEPGQPVSKWRLIGPAAPAAEEGHFQGTSFARFVRG